MSHSKEIVFELGDAYVKTLELTYSRSVQELPDGSWLITNTHKNNIVQINPLTGDFIRIINNDNYPLGIYWLRCATYDQQRDEMIIADGLNNRILFVDFLSCELKKSIFSNKHFNICDPHHIELHPEGQY